MMVLNGFPQPWSPGHLPSLVDDMWFNHFEARVICGTTPIDTRPTTSLDVMPPYRRASEIGLDSNAAGQGQLLCILFMCAVCARSLYRFALSEGIREVGQKSLFPCVDLCPLYTSIGPSI